VPWPRIAKTAAILLVVAASTALIKEYRHYFFPKRFRVVEPGAIYRGGQQTPRMLRKILEDNHIQTIINLDDKVLDENPRTGPDPYKAEKAIGGKYGVEYYGFLWGGDGIGPFDEYDTVADILATTFSRPIFLHCAGGKRRTNAALAAYWIRHCGYTVKQVADRLDRRDGFERKNEPHFFHHIEKYFQYAQRNQRGREERQRKPGTLPGER
jgi:protein tyrosine/serine phosphatase